MWKTGVDSKSFGLTGSDSSFLNKYQQKCYKQLIQCLWNFLRTSDHWHIEEGSSVVRWKGNGGASRCWGSTACDCLMSPCWGSGSRSVAVVSIAVPTLLQGDGGGRKRAASSGEFKPWHSSARSHGVAFTEMVKGGLKQELWVVYWHVGWE